MKKYKSYWIVAIGLTLLFTVINTLSPEGVNATEQRYLLALHNLCITDTNIVSHKEIPGSHLIWTENIGGTIASPRGFCK